MTSMYQCGAMKVLGAQQFYSLQEETLCEPGGEGPGAGLPSV